MRVRATHFSRKPGRRKPPNLRSRTHPRSRALPGNAMRGRLSLPSTTSSRNSPNIEAEPRWQCVPRRSLGTSQLFVRGYYAMIAAPVQCHVNGIPKGSHEVLLQRANDPAQQRRGCKSYTSGKPSCDRRLLPRLVRRAFAFRACYSTSSVTSSAIHPSASATRASKTLPAR
jgi:hypothetical protein